MKYKQIKITYDIYIYIGIKPIGINNNYIYKDILKY